MDLQLLIERHNVHVSKEDTAPLSASVDYNLRVVIQEAMKFARHSKRARLMPADVTKSLRTLSAPPSYVGPSSRDPLAFPLAKAAHDHDYDTSSAKTVDSFLVHSNQRISLVDLKRIDLPRLPLEPALAASWLAVDGQQTGVPASSSSSSSSSSSKKKRKRRRGGTSESGNSGKGGSSSSSSSGAVVVDPGVYHSISHQQRKLLADLISKITPDLVAASSSSGIGDDDDEDDETKLRRTAALRVVSSSEGLQPLLPYFIHHITTTINANLRNLHVRTRRGSTCSSTCSSILLWWSRACTGVYLHVVFLLSFCCLLVISGIAVHVTFCICFTSQSLRGC